MVPCVGSTSSVGTGVGTGVGAGVGEGVGVAVPVAAVDGVITGEADKLPVAFASAEYLAGVENITIPEFLGMSSLLQPAAQRQINITNRLNMMNLVKPIFCCFTSALPFFLYSWNLIALFYHSVDILSNSIYRKTVS